MENIQKESPAIVQIDEMHLDKECIRLPSQFLQFAHFAADKRRDVDECKAQLDVVEADLGRRIRDMPNKFGLEKVTEAALVGTILLQKEYKEALGNLNKARYQSDLVQAVVSALEHKKRTLTLLVELHGMGYFSSVKVSEKGKEAIDEMNKRRARKLRDEDRD